MGLFGNSKEKNQKKAAQYYEAGLNYYEGRNKPKNMVQAMSYFRQAAERDHVGACRALGWIYLYEPDFNHNVTEAVHWYELGAKHGDPECMCNLAAVLCNEEEVENHAEAFQWFCRASETGSEEGCYYRARFLEQGIGTDADEAEAKVWYEKAWKAGSRDAAEDLAVLWESDMIPLDLEKEEDCLQAAGLLDQAAKWHDLAAGTVPEEPETAAMAQTDESGEETEEARARRIARERSQRAEDCRKAAAEYRNRAEEIQNRAREALRNAPEPERAYCIVLAGDYAALGENVFAALKLYASERFECVEGDREEYVFFWFEDQGQAVQVTCYYDFTVMMERLKEGSLPLSRLVPLFSESYGLTETMRLCMEQAWESGCSTMLPVFVLFGEEDELSRLVQMDLLSYARGTGGCSHPDLYRAGNGIPAEFWCSAVLDPMETWWEEGNAIPAEVLKERRLASKKKKHDHSENAQKDTEAGAETEMKAADTQQAQVSKENAESGKIEENTETAENMETEKTMPLAENAEEKATDEPCAESAEAAETSHTESAEVSGEAEIPDDKQNPEGVAEEEDATPTDEDLQAAIEAARQRRLEADKKSL